METSGTGPSEPARALGRRLDQFLGLLGRLPGWSWGIAAVVVLAWTYPRQLHPRTVVGITLDDRLSLWISSVVMIGLMIVVGALSLFVLRSLLHYMEENRWPKRAAGVEMEEISHVGAQLQLDADVLSNAADQNHKLVRVLDEARDTIVFLTAELERARGAKQEGTDESKKLGEGK
jgi:hypothetical protein